MAALNNLPRPPDLAALAAALIPLARRYAWRLVVLFGSVARDGQGRDLDLAVLPRVQPELLEQGRWWSDLDAWLSDYLASAAGPSAPPRGRAAERNPAITHLPRFVLW